MAVPENAQELIVRDFGRVKFNLNNLSMASPACRFSTHCLTVNAGTLSSLPKKVTPRITPLTASIFKASPIDPTTKDEAMKKNRNILFRNDSRNVSKKIPGLNILRDSLYENGLQGPLINI